MYNVRESRADVCNIYLNLQLFIQITGDCNKVTHSFDEITSYDGAVTIFCISTIPQNVEN